jgi:hypothetical protein
VSEPSGGASRVQVMHQRRRAARVDPPASHVVELAEETGVGEVLLHTLMRRQLRLAMRLLVFTAGPLLVLPLAYRAAPSFGQWRIAGVSVAWVFLGAAVYPLLFLAARLYLRRCERNEAEFVDLVNRR